MNEQTLYEIEQLIDIILYTDPDNPLTPEQEAANLRLLAEYAEKEADKIDAIGSVMKSIEAGIAARKEEARRLADTAKNLESKLARMKDYFIHVLISRPEQERKIKGNIYTLSLRYTPSVVIDNMESIPKEYIRTKTEVSADKIALKKALADGNIPGCHIEKNASLQLK